MRFGFEGVLGFLVNNGLLICLGIFKFGRGYLFFWVFVNFGLLFVRKKNMVVFEN